MANSYKLQVLGVASPRTEGGYIGSYGRTRCIADAKRISKENSCTCIVLSAQNVMLERYENGQAASLFPELSS